MPDVRRDYSGGKGRDNQVGGKDVRGQGRRVTEDNPAWNPRTMGNKRSGRQMKRQGRNSGR